MNAILFVQFKDAKRADELGFSKDFAYPVYHVDAAENQDGNLVASFLVANREGTFHWVEQEDVSRAKQNGQGQKGRKRPFGDKQSQTRYDGGRDKSRKPRSPERFGDQRYEQPAYPGQPQLKQE